MKKVIWGLVITAVVIVVLVVINIIPQLFVMM